MKFPSPDMVGLGNFISVAIVLLLSLNVIVNCDNTTAVTTLNLNDSIVDQDGMLFFFIKYCNSKINQVIILIYLAICKKILYLARIRWGRIGLD